jgi:hypothetical protein
MTPVEWTRSAWSTRFCAWLVGAMIGAGLVVAVQVLTLRPQSTDRPLAVDRPSSSAVEPTPTSHDDDQPADDSDDVRDVDLVWNEFKDDSATLRYSLGARYPQIVNPDTPSTRAFNRIVREEVFRRLTPLQNALLRSPRHEADLPDVADELQYSAYIVYARPELISVILNAHDYSWPAAHGGNTCESITMDLRSGRRLSLSDLFRARSNFLAVIAQYCADDLARRGPQCGPGTLFAGGTAPTAKHYRTWNVTKAGLLITFDEYQVAAHTEGQPTVIVPYEALKTVVDRRGPLRTLLQG